LFYIYNLKNKTSIIQGGGYEDNCLLIFDPVYGSEL